MHDEHLSKMKAGGVQVEKTLGSGQLKVFASEQTYVKDEVFVVDRMYSLLEQSLANASKGKFKAVRTLGDMEWALKNFPGTDDLMCYEAKVNIMAPHYDCTLLCGYDVNRISGRTIADILATHSHIILNGRIRENPYFVDPLTFLKNFALRRRTMDHL